MQVVSNVTVNYRFSAVYQGKIGVGTICSIFLAQCAVFIGLLKHMLKRETLTVLCAVAV